MKTSLFLFSILFSICSFGQDKTQDTSFVTFTQILNFDSLTKQEIFDKSLVWCSKSFKSSKDAINVKEREGGIIAGKGISTISFKYENVKNKKIRDATLFREWKYDWMIQIKESKLKISILNIVENNSGTAYVPLIYGACPYKNPLINSQNLQNEYDAARTEFLEHCKSLAKSLYSEIINNKDDW